jgi:hypothetical protein
MNVWTNQATRKIDNNRRSRASRSMVVFEVLDYDSLTHVKRADERVSVVALIYKRVTITQTQERTYALAFVNEDETNIKDIKMESRPVWELDAVPAVDNFVYSGTRKVEYKFCLVIGGASNIIDLGHAVDISVGGTYKIAGKNIDLIEGAYDPPASPTVSISGKRLYGVSVNCGKNAVTYSFDVEERNERTIVLDSDSAINLEDDNAYWTKRHRVVGAMNYFGKSDSREFVYGASGTAGFPNKVMAVGYMDTRRS